MPPVGCWKRRRRTRVTEWDGAGCGRGQRAQPPSVQRTRERVVTPAYADERVWPHRREHFLSHRLWLTTPGCLLRDLKMLSSTRSRAATTAAMPSARGLAFLANRELAGLMHEPKEPRPRRPHPQPEPETPSGLRPVRHPREAVAILHARKETSAGPGCRANRPRRRRIPIAACVLVDTE
jgi:hypothetical protein